MNVLKALLRQSLVIVVPVGLALLALRTHENGHDWGDDFALYLRQAASLFGGTSVSDVIADNQYMLEYSYRSDFSPPLYPWGWPLILAIPVWLVGLDVDRLKLVSLVLFAGVLLAFYVYSVGRVGVRKAVLGVLLIGTSPIYIDWTELLLSELPFMLLAFAGLIAIDRTRGLWTSSWWSGVGPGVLAAAAFSVRREGLSLLVAIGVAILADRVLVDRERRWRAFSPFISFAAAVALLQIGLSSTLIPNYAENTIVNVVRFGNIIAQLIGGMLGIGSPKFGWIVVILGCAGWALALAADWRKHAPSVAYLLTVIAVAGSFFVPSERYFSTAVPLLVLGILMIPSLFKGESRKLEGRLAAAVFLLVAPFIWLNTGRALAEAERPDSGSAVVEVGPNRIQSVEMFDAVRMETATDDVIGFFKARAMTLYTDRRSVQIEEADPLNPGSQFDVLVLRSDETSEEDRLDIAKDYDIVWFNETFEVLNPKR